MKFYARIWHGRLLKCLKKTSISSDALDLSGWAKIFWPSPFDTKFESTIYRLSHAFYLQPFTRINSQNKIMQNKQRKHSTKRIFHSCKRQFTDGFASMEMGVSWNHRMLTTSRNLFGPEIFSFINSFKNISAFSLVSTTVDDQSDCHDWRYSKTKTNQHELIELCLLQTLIKLHEITEHCPRDSKTE